MENPKRFLPLIPALLLFGSLINGWPYAYFQILRWVVCVSSGIVAWGSLKNNSTFIAALFGCVAILFNPTAPIYLSRSAWLPIDIAVGVMFLLLLLRKS